MKLSLASAARVVPLIALLSAACVSQSAYQQQQEQLEEAREQAAAQQAQIAKMQREQKWVVAGDLLFPEGGYELGPNAQAALGQYTQRLQNLQNAKVVVYGYTDNQPVGPALQRAGITNNIDLSSRRADNVVAGTDPEKVKLEAFKVLEGHSKQGRRPALWDGRAAERIVAILGRELA